MSTSPTISYLNGFSDEKTAIAALSTQNIRAAYVPQIDAYICNYEQIPSNPAGFGKRHPVLRECRNLVIRYNKTTSSWQVIGKSFVRFFNLNESPDDTLVLQEFFNKGAVTASVKLDGSIMLFAFVDGEWRIFTRGSYADTNPFRGTVTNMPTSSTSDNDTFGSRARKYVDLTKLDPKYYYVFELCTPGAHITQYDHEFLALLAVVDSETHGEVPNPLPAKFTQITPDNNHIREPIRFPVSSIEQLKEILSQQTPDFEGYVLTAKFPDSNVPFRIKVKSESYIALHHIGTKTFTLEDLCRVVVSGEDAEVGSVTSIHKPVLEKLGTLYSDVLAAIAAFHIDNSMLPRKTYALYICERLPLPDVATDHKSNIPTPIPSQDHPAVTKYPAITKATFKPFQWLYFDLHAKKITFTVNPDHSTDLRTILAASDRAEKTASALAALHCRLVVS